MTVDIPMRFDDLPLLWVVENVYTPAECAAFVNFIERASPSLATGNPLYRDQDRVIDDNADVAADLLLRLRSHLPEKMGTLSLSSVNERLRFYRYRPGQRFLPHMDHWYQPTERKITLLTLLVYFNDDFGGGETRFQEQIEMVVEPKPGMVAVFQHKIRHEGCAVLHGTKYAMRSDVFYESSELIGKVGVACP